MFHSVSYKMPRARKVSDFTVYPFSADTINIKLQSENHCMVCYVSGELKGKTFISKRFAQYPRFEYCSPSLGGKMIDTPKEIADQIETILQTPTGKIVSLF